MNEINLTNKQKKLRYVIVYDKLFTMINEGIFPKGSRLPSEPELAKSIGVSRTTLRQALALLQDDGLIKNIQGKGNFIIKSTSNKSLGLESVGNPIYKCLDESIDNVEIEFHIEPPTDYINQTLVKKTAACVLVDRWYKSNNNVIAYSFTLIPIETISQFNIDLNNKDELLIFLEKIIYEESTNALLEIKNSTSGNFSPKKYTLTSKGHCYLIQEALYERSDYPIIFNKHYLPTELSSLKINSTQ